MLNYTDPVHNVTFAIPPIIGAIIQTADFQRLRSIKQLGILYIKWNNATYTRYEHCIGTYYLANKMLTKLEENSCNLKIPQLYKNCVNIAALLHDIGHGPFSHFWEHINTDLSHEENSSNCIDRIFDEIGTEFPLGTTKEDQIFGIELIKALIQSNLNNNNLSRPIENNYRFIFEIVNNKENGLDVDKWDYLLRDAFYLKDNINFSVNLDFNPIFCEARVLSNGEHIEYNFEHWDKIYNLYDARSKFHLNLYRTPSIHAGENFIIRCVDIIRQKKADDSFFRITSANKEDFLNLTDNALWRHLENYHIDIIDYIVDRVKNDKLIEIDENEYLKNKDNPFFIQVQIKIECPDLHMRKVKLFYNQPQKTLETIELKDDYYYNNAFFKLVD